MDEPRYTTKFEGSETVKIIGCEKANMAEYYQIKELAKNTGISMVEAARILTA